ncbi:pentapeptide repeat-containing protein [Roseofilum casamattae]|uniref:Pentapeptide repeat-containing protein n=1 Tax=Roseofilum casamattae BLCC-M143 TaxID=3022442 RepID=A0ABT7BZI8_9CYAN|nr:pentapeptide repeat-containing protein [Roseofilum casamattae]MDJ1184207.1 pentapeptide repeat-containing protein [Roseofilum casamattae BLCC-M143]
MADKVYRSHLRNANFRGKQLVGADFSETDIRGVDFGNANLVGANFTNARAGLSPMWSVSLMALFFVLSCFSGLVSGYSGAFVGDLLNNLAYDTSFLGALSFILLAIFLIVVSWQGLGAEIATLVQIVFACLIATLAFLPNDSLELINAIVFTNLALGGALVGVTNMALAVAIAQVMALPQARVLAGISGLLGVVLGVLLGVREAESYPVAGLVGFAVISIGMYTSWQAMAEDKKSEIIRSLAVTIVAKGSTSFHGADLTNADFTSATLKSVDFRQAILTRTCWFKAKDLNYARLEGTYLENPTVLNLVANKDGREKNFDRLNLRRLNLQDANLQDASFINADLSETNLRNANLFGAKLAQAQLYRAVLTGARLTGAYIQNWGISTDTLLDRVTCEYIYMQLPTKDDPDPCRKPDDRNQTFDTGDFANFMAPIIKTLDLYQTQNFDMRQLGRNVKIIDLFHYRDIDPTAVAISIIQLAENHPEAELEVVALQGQDREKIRLQAKVTGDANRNQLSAEYFENYTAIQALPDRDRQTMMVRIAEKDDHIRRLESLLEKALQSAKLYVETQYTRGDTIMSQSQESKGNINISDTQGSVSGVAGAGENLSMTGVAIGEISGNVTNTIGKLPQSSELEQPGIKELLTELQVAIETDSNLSQEDKIEALEQLQTIAEAGQKPEDGAMQKMVKRAMKFLKGTIADLPSTVGLVQTCTKLFPLITKFFGIS